MSEILDEIYLTCTGGSIDKPCYTKVLYTLSDGDDWYFGVCPDCGKVQKRHVDSMSVPRPYPKNEGNFLKSVTTDCLVSFAPKGEMIAVKGVMSSQVGGGERGLVSGFSQGSRSRMMKKISQLSKNFIPLFVTLTYPADFPTDREVYKAHLHAFFTVLRHHYKKFGSIWKLEFQKRGAAHYHLLLWGVPFSERDEVARLWCQVVGSQDKNHFAFHLGLLGNEHCVTEIRSWGGVVSYAGKYMSKLPEVQEETGEYITGRIWGIRGFVPLSPILQFRVDMITALDFKKSVMKQLGMNIKKRLGFWSFGFSPDHILLLQSLVDDFDFFHFPRSDILDNFPDESYL